MQWDYRIVINCGHTGRENISLYSLFYWISVEVLSGWPMHRSSPQQMQVKMENRLSAISAIINDQAVAVLLKTKVFGH